MLIGGTKTAYINCTDATECDGLFRWMHDDSLIQYNASWWNETDMQAFSIPGDPFPESCVAFINDLNFKGLGIS